MAGSGRGPTDMGESNALFRYWAHGEGAAKWINDPHPFTRLVELLSKYVSPNIAKGLAANIYHAALGHWPGERGGKNPTGPG